jgi:hypothetical protein
MSIKADTHEKSLSIELVPSLLENAWLSPSHTLAARRASTRALVLHPNGQAIGASVAAACNQLAVDDRETTSCAELKSSGVGSLAGR